MGLVETLAIGLVVGIVALIGLMMAFIIARQFLYICKPNEVLVFSGGGGKTGQGYKVVHGGRAFRIPVIERVSRVDLTVMPIDIRITNAYSKGGIPLTVLAIANVKISSEPNVVKNAIERFMGRDRNEVRQVAKETLEGHLRGVLANLTPEQVNEDRLLFAQKLREEAQDDLNKLGLQLDTLKIQNVSDDVDYLKSIGRERIAAIIRDAEIAESNSKNEADRRVADEKALAEVADAEAETEVARRRNHLSAIRANLGAKVKSASERAQAAGIEARMVAEQELQRARGQLEQLRLQAAEVLPAEAARQAAELVAEGQAARISEEGRAMEMSLQAINTAWQKAGPDAGEMLLLRQLDQVLAQVADAVSEVHVGSVNLVDGGDGRALPAYVSSYPAMVTAVLNEIRRAVGVDVVGGLGDSSDAHGGQA